MAERSFEAWKSWKDAQLKYDYYIVGLVAALFAYVGGNYVPQKIAFSQNTFELISILFLALSLIVGIRRLEVDLVFQTITLKHLEAKEMRRAANKVAAFGGSHNLDAGEIMTISEAQQRAMQMESAIEILNNGLSDVSNRATWLFKIRNWALILAFLILAVSKIIGAYSI